MKIVQETLSKTNTHWDTLIEKSMMKDVNKRFLSCITDSKDIEFSIFDNFMLIQEENSNLMLSFEQDFSDD